MPRKLALRNAVIAVIHLMVSLRGDLEVGLVSNAETVKMLRTLEDELCVVFGVFFTIFIMVAFFIVLLFICAYNAWVISPPYPTPSLTTHSAPSLSPPTPSIPGRTMCVLHFEMDMRLWGPGAECYGLDLKCPP
jgi:hypothetical protein